MEVTGQYVCFYQSLIFQTRSLLLVAAHLFSWTCWLMSSRGPDMTLPLPSVSVTVVSQYTASLWVLGIQAKVLLFAL